MADNNPNINDELVSRAESLKNAFAEISSATRIMNQELREAGEQASDYGGTYQSITRSASRVAEIQRKALDSQRGITAALNAQAKQQDNVRKLNAQINDLYDRALKATGDTRDILLKQAKNIANARDNAQDLSNIYQSIIDQASELNSKTKFFDRAAELVGELPGLGTLLSGPFTKAAETAREAAREGKGLLRTYAVGFKTLALEVGNIITISTITKVLLESTKQAKELSLALGVSQKAANQMQKDMTAFANSSSDSRITTQGLVEAQVKLQDQLKLGVQFSGDVLGNFIKLTEYMGVSEQAAAKIALVQESLGDSSNAFQKNLAQSVVESGAALGVNIPLKEAFEDIGQLSSETLLTLRRNPQALGQALVEAKKLGIELKDLAGISESLLNFEQSIQSELEAEVLTGRQLNLEQARIAAIQGDRLALTREIASQVGTISEFENMNVIQRESIAKAFGLNVTQMSEMLLRQEALNILGDKAADLSNEQLKAAQAKLGVTKDLGAALLEVQQEASATKNFENAAKQIQQAFQSIVLEVAPLVTKVSKLLADFLASPLGKIATVTAGGIGIVSKLISSIRGISPSLPIFTREVGVGGTGLGMAVGAGATSSAFAAAKARGLSDRQILAGFGGRAAMQEAQGVTSAGRAGGGMSMGRGLMIGGGAAIGGALIGSALSSAAENAATEGAALGLSSAGSALSMAGTGAMIGAIGGPVGMAVGAGIGAVVGGITGYMDRAEKQRQEAEAKRNEEFKSALREVAMREAKIYMNSVEVGRQVVNETPRI